MMCVSYGTLDSNTFRYINEALDEGKALHDVTCHTCSTPIKYELLRTVDEMAADTLQARDAH